MFDNVLITGLTPLDSYPRNGCKEFYKQVIQDTTLCIPSQKPDIESVNELKVSICLDSFKIINTVLGPKLIVEGTKFIKVIYTADNCQQSLHSAHWEVPFCEFILMKDLSYDKCLKSIDDIYIGVEEACVRCFTKRSVDISLIFVLCPMIKKDCYSHDPCGSYEPCRKHKVTKRGYCN